MLTAIKESNSIAIAALDRENWQTQLWTYVDGALINYANHLAIDVSSKYITTLYAYICIHEYLSSHA